MIKSNFSISELLCAYTRQLKRNNTVSPMSSNRNFLLRFSRIHFASKEDLCSPVPSYLIHPNIRPSTSLQLQRTSLESFHPILLLLTLLFLLFLISILTFLMRNDFRSRIPSNPTPSPPPSPSPPPYRPLNLLPMQFTVFRPISLPITKCICTVKSN